MTFSVGPLGLANTRYKWCADPIPPTAATSSCALLTARCSVCKTPPNGIPSPPPRVVPHPLSFPGGVGGGGPSLGQPKIFRCGSLCCCVGGCVVGHYHLHPLHSWQDILLTFGEMELDNTTMFPPGTSVMFIRSTGDLRTLAAL